MQIIPNAVKLPELGQVWGDPEAFDTFKTSVSERAPQRWETLCAWFRGATCDRGYVLEVPIGNKLAELLRGNSQLLSLTIIFGNPEAVAAQVQSGLKSYLLGGILMGLADGLELSVHT